MKLTTQLINEADRLAKARRYAYRERVSIERALFLVTADFCARVLGYQLGGLTVTHEHSFLDYGEADSANARIVKRAFALHGTLLALAPNDPSSRGNDGIVPDESRHQLAQGLADAIARFAHDIDAALEATP